MPGASPEFSSVEQPTVNREPTFDACGIALLIRFGKGRVYLVRELHARNARYVVNLNTETAKGDFVAKFTEHLRNGSDPLQLEQLLLLLKEELARTVLEEYGQIGDQEKLEVVVKLSPMMIQTTDDVKRDKQHVMLLSARAQLVTQAKRPVKHQPLKTDEVKTMGWHRLRVDRRDGEARYSISFRNLPPEAMFRSIGYYCLIHGISPAIDDVLSLASWYTGIVEVDGKQYFCCEVTAQDVQDARKRVNLPDYRNE